jgi:hypothetical protein
MIIFATKHQKNIIKLFVESFVNTSPNFVGKYLQKKLKFNKKCPKIFCHFAVAFKTFGRYSNT